MLSVVTIILSRLTKKATPLAEVGISLKTRTPTEESDLRKIMR